MSSEQPGILARGGWQTWKMDSIDDSSRARAAGGFPMVGDLERLQDQARREGHEDGYAAGHAEGLAAGADEALRLRNLAVALDESSSALRDEIADDVLSLALEVARQILHEALPVKRELLLPVVREAMQFLPAASPGAQIQLNPADVELVRAHFGEELRLNSWKIVEDHRIQPGGCRLNAVNCAVDATLASRWKRVLAALGRDHAWLAS